MFGVQIVGNNRFERARLCLPFGFTLGLRIMPERHLGQQLASGFAGVAEHQHIGASDGDAAAAPTDPILRDVIAKNATGAPSQSDPETIKLGVPEKFFVLAVRQGQSGDRFGVQF